MHAVLQKEEEIKCCITAACHCYSADLPQGGLEIPCKLVFSGHKVLIIKIKKLVPDGSHLAFSSAVSVPAGEQDNVQKATKTQIGATLLSQPETADAGHEVEVEDELHTKEEIILLQQNQIVKRLCRCYIFRK